MPSRRKELFPNVTDAEWNDWRWQVRNRVETLDELKKYIKLTPEEEEGVAKSLQTLRLAITPYYLSLIDPENPRCPVRRQAIPTAAMVTESPTTPLQVTSGSTPADSPPTAMTSSRVRYGSR